MFATNAYTFELIIIMLLTMLSPANGLRCYECTNANESDKPCLNGPLTDYAADCPEESKTCFKQSFFITGYYLKLGYRVNFVNNSTIGTKYTEVRMKTSRVVRACSSVVNPNYTTSCKKITAEGLVSIYDNCFCNEDLCNSSDPNSICKFIIIILPGLIMSGWLSFLRRK